MKKIILVLFAFLFSFNVYAEEEQKRMSVKEFNTIVSRFNKLEENINKIDFYKDLKIKSKKDQKIISIYNLEKFDQDMLMLSHMEKMHESINLFINNLEEEIALSADKEKKANNENDPAEDGDINNAIEQSKKIKMNFLNKYEEFLNNLFKENKLYFKANELNKYLEKIKKDKEELAN